ncbi:hypothetical protein [Halovulum sp. GXIMD14793]
MPLAPGDPLTYWQVTALDESAYDVADAPMQGEMDSTFFLTKDKNIIPHTYPCRTSYIAEVRGREPQPHITANWTGARNILPLGSAFLDLSGFWFRATRLKGWARTAVECEAGGSARLRLGIAGAAKLFVNGEVAGWLAPAQRNAMDEVEVDIVLRPGSNEIAVWFEDLAERDAVLRVQLSWISGPAAKAAYPYEVLPDILRGVEAAIAAMHLDTRHYDDDDIHLVLPVPFPDDVTGSVTICGHFMTHDAQAMPITIPARATRLRLAASGSLPPDYRYFHFALTCQSFKTEAKLGAEITNHTALGPVPGRPADRIAEALDWIASHGETDTETALACLGQGKATSLMRAEEIIAQKLAGIEACHDCADFALVPLIWGRMVYGERLSEALRARIDAAMLTYRYWMDEPGNDVQWYFSENHALLFHTAAYLAGRHLRDHVFVRSGRSGADQSAVGRERLHAWFDHFEAAEMAEFNSVPYFPIDLKGLTAIFALAPDADLRDRAHAAIVRLLTIVARSAHHGIITGAQGRSYEHSLCTTWTQELSGIARLLWGRGGYGAHVNCLTQLAICLRDYGLDVPDLTAVACWDRADAQEWCFWQGKDGFARLYHYKTRETALGSAARYRWQDWGYQETLIHGRIGRDPRAQVWINAPGEMVQTGYGRPSFWGGSASVPRVQQYRDLAIVRFHASAEHLDFTHAWFQTPVFDDWLVEGARASARAGCGVVLLQADGPLQLMKNGASADHELRLPGRQSLWVVRLGQAGDRAAFSARHRLVAVEEPDGTIRIDDADYGRVTFLPSGIVQAEGRIIDPQHWTMAGEVTILPTDAAATDNKQNAHAL